MAEPFSLSTGIVALVALALQLVVRTLGMVDTTIAAHQEVANQLGHLQEDLEDLQIQMTRIHGTLVVLASNTRDRGFRQLLGDHHGEAAIDGLCAALDETFMALKRLTRQTKAEELALHSRTLPTDTRTLAFVQAVLRHNLVPSTTTNLLRCLQDMRSEIEKCLKKLSNSFQHLWTLYIVMTNGLARVTTNGSILSTSTTLPARIKLVGWLKKREDIWKFFRRGKVATNGFIEQGFIEQGFIEQGFIEQGFTEQGFTEQGFTEQGSIESDPRGVPQPLDIFGFPQSICFSP